MLKLSPRMQMAADMVRPGKAICDIGTDHAYLPSFLVINGISPCAVAADIGKGPLENARRTVDAYGLKDKIALCLSDGLQNINPDDVDEIVICGMGGTLISEILSACEWIKSSKKHIICQPMSHAEDVRDFLCANGFNIEKEETCEDAGHIYVCMSAYYTGERKTFSPAYKYYGKLNVSDETSRKYLLVQLKRLKNRISGISENKEFSEELNLLKAITKEIEDVLADAEG